MGVALFGAFLTLRLNSSLAQVLPGIDLGKLQADATHMAGAMPAVPSFVKDLVAHAITDTFKLGLIATAVAGLIVVLIPAIALRDQRPERVAERT